MDLKTWLKMENLCKTDFGRDGLLNMKDEWAPVPPGL